MYLSFVDADGSLGWKHMDKQEYIKSKNAVYPEEAVLLSHQCCIFEFCFFECGLFLMLNKILNHSSLYSVLRGDRLNIATGGEWHKGKGKDK